MAEDFSQVHVTADAPSYASGATIKLTVTGTVGNPTSRVDTVTVSVADSVTGATGSTTVPITMTGTQQNPAKILSVTSSLGLVYTVAANGLTATATAP